MGVHVRVHEFVCVCVCVGWMQALTWLPRPLTLLLLATGLCPQWPWDRDSPTGPCASSAPGTAWQTGSPHHHCDRLRTVEDLPEPALTCRVTAA